MNAEIQLTRAIQARKVVELDYEGTGSRVVEPYVLYVRSEGRLLLGGFQRSGYSARGESEGWKTFAVERLSRITLLAESFQPRPDYSPDNAARYPRIIVRI